jgi:hypothetical protein
MNCADNTQTRRDQARFTDRSNRFSYSFDDLVARRRLRAHHLGHAITNRTIDHEFSHDDHLFGRMNGHIHLAWPDECAHSSGRQDDLHGKRVAGGSVVHIDAQGTSLNGSFLGAGFASIDIADRRASL